MSDERPPLRLVKIPTAYALAQWSDKVRERDGHTCQHCQTKEDLVAHHILLKDRHPEVALDVDNGITLCRPCHNQQHMRLRQAESEDEETLPFSPVRSADTMNKIIAARVQRLAQPLENE